MGYKTYTCSIARRCGGCEWLAVPYPIQLKRKLQAVTELLGEIAASDGCAIQNVRGMGPDSGGAPAEPIAYRHKAATPFAPGKRGRIRSGFYERGTHRIVPCQSCLVEDPRAREVLNAVARSAEELHIPAYQEDCGRGILRHAIVRSGYATDDVLLTLVTNGERLPHARELVDTLLARCPHITSIVQNVNTQRTNAILGRKCHTLYGSGVMHDELLGCRFEIGPTSFYQTNPAQTEVLYRLASDFAALEDGDSLLDAYCGTGTIGICLATLAREKNKRVKLCGVERVGGAVLCARRNAQANGLSAEAHFIRADATEYLAHAQDKPSVVVLDPPRAGSTTAFLSGVAAHKPRRIVYISCNIVSLERDLHILRTHGYRLADIAPVDMFPHTKHVECVALMSRTDG